MNKRDIIIPILLYVVSITIITAARTDKMLYKKNGKLFF